MNKAFHNKKEFQLKPNMFDFVGKRKELSGFSINHVPYNESKTSEGNFLTNYEMKYLQVPKLGKAKLIVLQIFLMYFFAILKKCCLRKLISKLFVRHSSGDK